MLLSVYITIFYPSEISSHDLYKHSSFYAIGGASFINYDNPESIFQNPANLMYLTTDTKYRINAQLISSLGLNDYITTFFGADPDGKISSEDDLITLAGSNKYLKIASSMSYLLSKKWAFVFEGIWTADTSFGQVSPIAIDMFSSYDISIGALYNIELFSLSIGFMPKIIYRSSINGILTANDLSASGILPSLGASNSAMSVGLDLGIIKKFTRTSYALSFKNLGTGFILLKNTTESIPNLPMSATLSSTTTYEIGKHKISSFISINKYLNYTESSWLNLLRFGLEANFTNTLFLRAGFMNTAYTFGVGVRYWLLEVNFSSFVEDSLMYANDTSFSWDKNRRYLMEFTLYF